MDNTVYATLNRQSGLLREIQSVANNIANSSTTGYRKEGIIFAEYVAFTGAEEPSLSLSNAVARRTSLEQGAMQQTGGQFDLAIDGNGFFMLATQNGDLLTRAGAFTASSDGIIVAPDGAALLDAGGAPIFAPPDARNVTVAADGTVSADGRPIAQIGLWEANDPNALTRMAGVRFKAEGGAVPVADGRILQGFVEGSNVAPVDEIARIIEVQRSYELGQTFLDREDDRIRAAIRTIGQQGG